MLSKADILFGKIAVNAGFVTEDQIDECIRIQEGLPDKKPLGIILLEKGYLTEETLQEIVEAQRQNLQERAIHTREKREDSLFGRLVVRFGFASEESVHECVRIQAKIEEDIFLRLGEIMVKKNYLTLSQVKEVLDYQKTKILFCAGCNTQFNAIMFTPGARIPCYKCGRELVVPEVITSVSAEDMPARTEEETTIDASPAQPVRARTPVPTPPGDSDKPTPPEGVPAVARAGAAAPASPAGPAAPPPATSSATSPATATASAAAAVEPAPVAAKTPRIAAAPGAATPSKPPSPGTGPAKS
ncbi:MAG: hypothetical protein HYZ53_02140 [Planctomycetes bacterium]|nr:hypothetical protein [Planctomycetota bacterium]